MDLPAKPTPRPEGLPLRPRTSQVIAQNADLQVKNSDPILHNIHSYQEGRTILNLAEPKQGMVVEKKMKKAGGQSLKCDVHNFMRGGPLRRGESLRGGHRRRRQVRDQGRPPGHVPDRHLPRGRRDQDGHGHRPRRGEGVLRREDQEVSRFAAPGRARALGGAPGLLVDGDGAPGRGPPRLRGVPPRAPAAPGAGSGPAHRPGAAGRLR